LAGSAPEPGRGLGRGSALLRGPGPGRAGQLHRLADRLGAAGAAGRGRRAGRGGPGRGLAGRHPARGRVLRRAGVHRHRLPRRLLHQLPPVPDGFPGQRPGPLRAGPPAGPGRGTFLWAHPGRHSVTDPLLVCAPLRFEARAVRRGLRDSARAAGSGRRAARAAAPAVVRTGYGPTRAADRAARLEADSFRMMAITGTAAGLAPDLNPGDLIVATEVVAVRDGRPDPATAVPIPSAPLLLGELRRAGLTAHAGRIGTAGHLVPGEGRGGLGPGGLIAADT